MQAFKITPAILAAFRTCYDGKGFIPFQDESLNFFVPVSYLDDDKFNLGSELQGCEIETVVIV
jgi:hypothetical protein